MRARFIDWYDVLESACLLSVIKFVLICASLVLEPDDALSEEEDILEIS